MTTDTLTQSPTIITLQEDSMDAATNAAAEYLSRQSRHSHPQGRTDNAGRWFPSDEEAQSCCSAIRTPSRAWPWTLMLHCRTAQHIAHLYQVNVRDVRAAVRELRAIEAEFAASDPHSHAA